MSKILHFVWIATVLSACGDDGDPGGSGAINGTWRLNRVTLKSDVAETNVAIGAGVNIEATFSSSNEYNFSSGGTEQAGTYSIDDNSGMLSVTNNSGSNQFEIIEMTDSEITYLAATIDPSANLTQATADMLHFASLNFISRGQNLENELSRSQKFDIIFQLQKTGQ